MPTKWGLVFGQNITQLEDSSFLAFSILRLKTVLKRLLVLIIKLMWVAAEWINHLGCNKSTPISVLRSHDLTPWIIPLSAGTALVEVSSEGFMSPPLKGFPSGCWEVIQFPEQQIRGSCLKRRETNKSPWLVLQHDFETRRGNYLAEAPRSRLQTLMTCCYVWPRCICHSYFMATRISQQSGEAALAAGLKGTPNESAERGESAPAQTR